VRPFANVQLLGVVLQWITALMLVGVFLFFRGEGDARRTIAIWLGVWVAHAVAVSAFALESLAYLTGHFPHPVIDLLIWLHWPASLASPVLVLLGSLCLLEGRTPSRSTVVVVSAGIASAFLIPLLGLDEIASRMRDLLVPTLLFTSAVVVISRSDGVRRQGLVLLGVALTVYAIASTVAVLAMMGFTTIPESVIIPLQLSAGFGEVIALVGLASAVIIMIVQDSLLLADRAREERLVAVATSEARLAAIIGAAAEAIVTVNDVGRIELVNPATERLFGADAATLLGRPIADFLPAAGVGTRRDGTAFPVEVTEGALGGRPGGGRVVLVRDLTEQRALQEERARLEQQMAESEKMLAIGRIASGVAHELNNPLSVVLGQSEQLVAEMPDGEARTGLQLINEQAFRARHIVKDLLAFVRPREDRRAAFAIQPVVQRAMASVERQLTGSATGLAVTMPEVHLEVLADAVAVEQVLVNLLENAIDAVGAQGAVRVVVQVIGEMVELVVEDSGPGVPDAAMPRLFEPFFTTKPIGEGTGLGLPVSLGLIEQQGGTLAFENRPAEGIGARVRVRLPLAAPRPETVEPHHPPAATFPLPPRRQNGEVGEVLLIDDEVAVRATLGRMFRRSGWRVREASRGEEALATLLGEGAGPLPEVIFCDLRMPGLSGQQVHDILAGESPDLLRRFAFVTGDVIADGTARFLIECGRPVLEKPFTIAEAAAVVERILSPD
jgi:signal transduction histidine kinase